MMAMTQDNSAGEAQQFSTTAKVLFLLAAVVFTGLICALGIFDIGFYSLLGIMALIGTGAVNWKLKHSAWFWSVMTFSAVLNAALVVWMVKVFPLSQHKGHLDLKGFLPLVIVDAAIMTGIIRLPGALKDIYGPVNSDSHEGGNDQ